MKFSTARTFKVVELRGMAAGNPFRFVDERGNAWGNPHMKIIFVDDYCSVNSTKPHAALTVDLYDGKVYFKDEATPVVPFVSTLIEDK